MSVTINGSNTSIFASDGNVGIGTSSPGYKLHVNKGTSGDLVNFTDGIAQSLVLKTNATSFVLDESNGGNIVFAQSNTERMRIDSSGNLLVGTTSTLVSPGGKIQIYATRGYTHKSDSSGFGLPCQFLNSAGAEVGYVSTNNTNTTYVTSSDYRLKENIQPMQNALDVVAQLNPVTYTWKADGSDGQGFIAHELQAVVPDCVTGEKDATRIEEYEVTPAVPAVYEEVVIPAVLDEEGNVIAAEMIDRQLVTAEVPAVMGEREVPVYQGIDTSFLVATLCKAIQEQQAQIETLTAKVAALEAK